MSDDQALAKKELSGINEKIKSMRNQIQESNIKNQVLKLTHVIVRWTLFLAQLKYLGRDYQVSSKGVIDWARLFDLSPAFCNKSSGLVIL